MSCKEILKILKEFKVKHAEEYGILSMGVFGSAARNHATDKSDVDVVVKLKKQDLFNIIGIKQDLEEQFHYSVDLVSYRERMNEFLKRRIDNEAFYV